MKNFLFFSLLALSLGVSLPAYSQIANTLNITGFIFDVTGQGVSNVEVTFAITTDQTNPSVYSHITDDVGNFQFIIDIDNASGQGCGDISFVNCDGNEIIETICWYPNGTDISLAFIYCENVIDPTCSVDIINAGDGTFPTILFADPQGHEPYTYYWSDGSPTSFILVLNPGTYCVTMSDASGCGTESCITLPSNDSCFVSIEYSGIGLTAFATGNEPLSYLWNTGDTTQSIQPVEEGQFCVTVVDANQCMATGCFDTTEPECSVSLLCDPVTNGVELWAIGEGAGVFDYEWSTGDTSLWILVQEAGEYCVTATDALGCVADTCMYIDLNWTPDSCFVFISIFDDPFNDSYTLTAVSNAGDNGQYLWTTGQSGPRIQVDSPGTYCVTAYTANGCEVSNCIIIEPNNTDCWVQIERAIGSTTDYGVLYAFTENNENYEFIWQDGTTGPEFVIPGPGEYCVTAINILTGCAITSCYYVEGEHNCEVELTCDPFDGGILLFANGWGAEPITYHWETGEEGPYLEVFESGYYCVRMVDAFGCVAEACQEVIIDIQNCWVEIEHVYTDVSTFGYLIAHTFDNAQFEFYWSNGEIGPEFHIPGPGEYCVTATNIITGCISTACYVVEINHNCWVELICDPFDEGALLFAEGYGIDPLTYQWNTGDSGQIIEVFHSGYYCVTMSDATGCVAEACKEVHIEPQDSCWVGIELINENPRDGFDTLIAQAHTFGMDVQYIWSDGSSGPFLGVSLPGEYCVTAFFNNNCIASACLYYAPGACLNLSGFDFGDCDLALGVAWNGEECMYISGCSTVATNGIDYEAFFFPSFEVCMDHCGVECLNVANVDFGPCDAILGVGWNGEECMYISGCSPIGSNGIDYSPYIYPSFEICLDHCADDCLDLSDLDFGLCDAIIGVGWNGQECVSFSGCSTTASNGVDYGPYFFDSYEACFDHCKTNENCSNSINPLQDLPWIWQLLYESDSLFGFDILCECGYELNQYCYGEEPVYVLEPAPNGLCADVFSFYYTEQGELICTTGGLPGFTCDAFDPNVDLIFKRKVWECEPCICPAIYDPVCGSDGVTYENSCYAECAGVEWTPGECGNTVCDSLNTGTSVIPQWLSEMIRELNEYQAGCQGIQRISAVFYEGQYGFLVDDWNATDGEDFILDCEGNYVCSAGGGWGPANCPPYEILYAVWECEPTECAVFILCDPSPNGAELWAQGTGIEPIEYVWSNGDVGEWSFASETGTYCVTMTDAFGCVADACLFVDLTDVMDPCFSYIMVEIIDQGQAAVLSGKNNSPGPYEFAWSNGSTAESIVVVENGIYCVDITTINGCQSTACIEIILADPNQCTVVIEEDVTSANRQLEAIAHGTAPFSYSWNTGETTSVIFPTESGVYCVEVIDGNGCVAENCVIFDRDPNDGLVQIFGPLLIQEQQFTDDIEGYVVLFQIKETDELIAVDTAYTYQLTGTLPNYLFIDVEPGRYLTKAFITKPEEVYVPTYHFSAPFWNTAEIIEAYEPFNYAMIEMLTIRDHEGNGFISGQVFAGDNFHADEGEPTKSAGEGLANVELLIYDQWDVLMDYSMTDGEGYFSFEDLDYGTYTIYLEIPGIEQAVQVVQITANHTEFTNIGFEVNGGTASPTSIEDIKNLMSIELYPNPVAADLSLKFEMNEKSSLQIRVTNLEGKVMYDESIDFSAGRNDKSIPVGDLTSGMYILQIRDQTGVHSQRFVKL